MKRMVSLACVLALAVSMMAGCSSKSEETKAAETTADTVAETTAETAGESAAAGDSGKLIMLLRLVLLHMSIQKMERPLLVWMWISLMKSQKLWVKNWKSRI